MQDAMAEFATLETSVGSVALGMKICIGAGDVLGLSAGGGLRWRRGAARRPATRLRRASPICTHGVEGMEFPMVVYLACYDILRNSGNIAAADRLLAEARTLLTQRADAITDLSMRASLLHNIETNRRVMEGGQTLGPKMD